MRNIEIEIDKEDFKKKLGLKDGEPGKDSMVPGPKGDPGKDGKDSTVPGPKGDRGDDGSPDTGEDIVTKINSTTKTIQAKNVAGLEQAIAELRAIGRNPQGGGGGRTVRYLQNGTEVSAHVTELNFSTGITVTYDLNGRLTVTGAAGSSAWGGITGTLSDQTDLQDALDLKEPLKGADDNYVTDAEKTVIGNTSGTNTGDNATNSQYSGLAASKQDTLVSGTNIKTINGSSILGSGDLVIPGGGVSGQATVDFGASTGENSIARVTVFTASALTASIIMVSPAGIATADHDPDDYQWDNISGYVSNIVNGVSFDIIGVAPNGSWGDYVFNYVIQ